MYFENYIYSFCITCFQIIDLYRVIQLIQLYYCYKSTMPPMTRFMEKGLIFWLPDEIQQLIFKYLPLSSIKRCRLVSRRWRSLVDSPSVLRCAKMEIVYDEDNPIMNIVKRLSCDLTKYVGEVILKHDIKEDTRKLVEPFSSYLGLLGIEVDLSEVKSVFNSDFFWNSSILPILVIRHTKSRQENPVSMCLDIRRITNVTLSSIPSKVLKIKN